MDDVEWSWPFWKFGLKRQDLSGKLHDQYNTFSSCIQDPEAFHHDVFELSNIADTTEEFCRLLGDRKQQRLRELNESLESAAVEIIGNPSLIGTEQWQHAIQLFRTRSLDSLVRYFASYLPDDHPWHFDSASTSETASTDGSLVNSQDSYYDEDFEDGPVMTDEPLGVSTDSDSYPTKSHLQPSPRSMNMCSGLSPIDGCSQDDHSDPDKLAPARTLSFSETESDHYEPLGSQSHHEDKYESTDPETPASSISDFSEASSFGALDRIAEKAVLNGEEDVALSGREYSLAPVLSDVAELESETPTPKPDQASRSFFDTKLSSPCRRNRSASPPRFHHTPSYHTHSHHTHAHIRQDVLRSSITSRQRRREGSPGVVISRWRGGEPASRVQKPLPEPIRTRPRVSRRLGV